VEQVVKSIYKFILDLLLPESCLGCQKKGEVLCDKCIMGIRHAERDIGKDIFGIFDYRDPLIKKVIWKLKYHKRSHIGERLGEILYDEYIEEISDMKEISRGSPILVIPVPLSVRRYRMRGYNQAEKIARGLCNQTKDNILQINTQIIYKNKDTLPQAKLTNRKVRLKNIHDAFSVRNKEKVKGKTIIIVDDVTTTGGTMIEIMKILKKEGAKKIVGFAVAH
jgi:ComF family protein